MTRFVSASGHSFDKRAGKCTKTELWRRIDEMCRFCLYDPKADGTWVAQVDACTEPGCPLYPIRRIVVVKHPPAGKAGAPS